MVTLRSYRDDDLAALYDICLTTGASGADASSQHSDPKLVGHIYAAPYGVLEPDNVLVAEDDQGVAGYLVGTYDTLALAARMESEWWPALRNRYATSSAALTAADQQRIDAIMSPESSPAEIVAGYPAHIHMNLRARLRGQRIGTALLERWVARARAAGVRGIHLGANTENTGGVAFWQRSGFVPLQTVGRTVWMGMMLAD